MSCKVSVVLADPVIGINLVWKYGTNTGQLPNGTDVSLDTHVVINPDKNISYAESSLTISHVRGYHGGKYFCVAELPLTTPGRIAHFNKVVDLMAGTVPNFFFFIIYKHISNQIGMYKNILTLFLVCFDIQFLLMGNRFCKKVETPYIVKIELPTTSSFPRMFQEIQKLSHEIYLMKNRCVIHPFYTIFTNSVHICNHFHSYK